MLTLLDANVIVSGVLSPRSPCAALLAMVRAGRVQAVISPALLAELEDVLSRPKFRRRVPADRRAQLLDELTELCLIMTPQLEMVGVTRDPKDDYLVTLAVSAGVDLLVSGDKDLLAVDPEVVRVVTPREAVDGMGG